MRNYLDNKTNEEIDMEQMANDKDIRARRMAFEYDYEHWSLTGDLIRKSEKVVDNSNPSI
jgi:hypothetical protein